MTTAPLDPLGRAIDDLVDRVARVDWDTLDAATRDATGRVLFDALGIAAGGVAAPGIAPTRAGLADVAGDGEVPVPWTDLVLAPADAAFALSLLIHAWDFDDTHDEAVVHACTVSVPAAYAAAHATGASGRRMLEGVIAGIEVISRLSLVLGAQRGMIRTAGLGALGASAAVARVLGLDPDGMSTALSLAMPMSASPTSRQVVEDGAITKRHQPGFGVRHGVLAAFLARAGVEGPGGWFAGSYGLTRLIADPEVARTSLAREGWEVTRLSLKPYPACRYVHASVAGALALRDEVADVASVRVHVPEGMAHQLVARPWARRGRPIVDAQFSIPWSVAAALVRGALDLGALTDEALHDEPTEALANRVDVTQDLHADGLGMTPVVVVLRDPSGEERRIEMTTIPGSPQAPLGWDAIATKVRGCLRVAGLPEQLADQLGTEVRHLADRDVRAGLSSVLPGAVVVPSR